MRIPRVLPVAAWAAMLAACDSESPSNLAPTAAFTLQCDQLECVSTNASADPDGTIDTYDWNFGDGSAHVTTREAAHQYESTGLFLVTLTVTDDQGASVTARKDVNVTGNIPPVASFTTSCTDLECQFNNQSFDRNPGRLTSFVWDFGDNSPTVTTRNAAHTYFTPGEYTVTLTVTDDGGATARKTARVNAHLPPPTATFTYTCTEFTCEFTAQSSGFDAPIASYAWTFGDGSTSNEAGPSHTFAEAGYYMVYLTITDNVGIQAVASQQVPLPAAGMRAAFTVSCIGPECTFTDDSRPIGSVGFWSWDFGDGETSTSQNPTHVYRVSVPTKFTVTLGIADSWFDGGDQVSQEITVMP